MFYFLCTLATSVVQLYLYSLGSRIICFILVILNVLVEVL